ncbi:zinc finger BED domain-containing protein 3 [Antechinus flavipes]|uniref:zinc finger BED domain-containing protein 3 n=1 Tax=Antechinus flavipes TaxID=38775 RepID=UPI0022358810|nr:zinc finger BED domain-containing protein 3 [Antechinus flavipes]XP_051847845.1 zinc finger BED domain-containing protein 3 [Antechinus flavipes]XP_051847852.1 zinc finger BED domain-containing protein 3 [Antechinus flavipes]XP_051847860.1 zinc finger BED domain-containing protein 3 [Antechinus flavipes]XP_051847868.1 zinc finger BED domain-containing protein 3 [Antechinus flavipes]XP_051847877.1 zinc finger BED domain-containing protein 3 [Antechinus flavipes]XP_051847884.1 zinc finger BE
MEEGGPYIDALRSVAPAAHGRGARYSEAWEYFHLPLAHSGLPASQYATCRLCGKQVSRGPGFNVGTTALWKHLKSMHKQELEKSGPRQPGLRPEAPLPPLPPSPPGVEGDWGRLMEQMGALALRASQRERELEKRERAVERRERVLELRKRAIEEEEKELSEKRQELQAEKEELRARLLLVCQRESALALATAPLATLVKEEQEDRGEGCFVPKVLF